MKPGLFENFIDLAKDKSTLKAKCRNVFNWYFERDWQIGRVNKSNKTKEQIMATRQEHAIKIAQVYLPTNTKSLTAHGIYLKLQKIVEQLAQLL